MTILTKRICNRRASAGRRRRGFTLVEMLVTVAVTLLLMLALVNFFEWIGESTRDGRAGMEMAGPLRGATTRLQNDLDMLTVPVRPWASEASGGGYFEYLEGAGHDDTSAATDNVTGDIDDVLMFTAHSFGETFVGRWRNPGSGNFELIESHDAEIIWWAAWDDVNDNSLVDDGEIVVRRRVLLIRPDLDLSTFAPATNAAGTVISFFNSNDVSARPNPAGTGMVANSLADLSRRENRFAHDARVVGGAAPGFPYRIDVSSLQSRWAPSIPPPALAIAATLRQIDHPTNSSESRQGEDIILSNIRGFDVRAYEPSAYVRYNAGVAVSPGDPGWNTAPATPYGQGAFVDLNYGNHVAAFTPPAGAEPPPFSLPPNAKSKLHANAGLPVMATYDTWTLEYEKDGIDQDDGGMNPPVDEGLNGLDDDNANGIDDLAERETSPPYPFPLRGLQVRIRIYDADTRQVRQASVVADFTP